MGETGFEKELLSREDITWEGARELYREYYPNYV